MGYLLLADSHSYVCRTRDDLVGRLLWARDQACVKAKARFTNGDIDPPLMPSEQARLVEAATEWRRRRPETCCRPRSGGWCGTAGSGRLGPRRGRAGPAGPP